MDSVIPYLLPWGVATVVVGAIVLALGNLLEMMPDTIPGLVWRSALTGAVFLGAGELAASIPISAPILITALQVLALMMCSFIFFGHSFPDESQYAFGFGVAVFLTYMLAVVVLGTMASG